MNYGLQYSKSCVNEIGGINDTFEARVKQVVLRGIDERAINGGT